MPQSESSGFSEHPRNIQYTSKVARILNQTESGIARVFAEQSENFLERQYGTVFAVLDLDFSSDSYDIGEVLVDTLTREYFSDLNRTAVQSFEHALTAVNQTLADLASEGQNDWVGKLNALVGVLHENEVHLSLAGKAEAYLVRGPSVTHITAELRGTSPAATAKTFLSIASGTLEVGDKLLFATDEVFQHLSQNDIRRHLYLHPPNRSIRKIADQLTSRGRPGRLAAVVVELTTIDLISAEAVSDEPDELILGAPRGHFEALGRLRPFREDTPIAELVSKARKHWDKRLQPRLKRALGESGHKARSWVAARRGQAPPPPPPHAAAGTPEPPAPVGSHHATEPGQPDTLGTIKRRIDPALSKAGASAVQALSAAGRLAGQAWQKSGIPKTRAWQKVRQVTAPVTSRLARLARTGGDSQRATLYRNLILALAVIFIISLATSIHSSQNRKADARVQAAIAKVQEVQAKAEASFIFKDIPAARAQVDEAKKQSDALAKEKHLKADVAHVQQSVDASYGRINNVVSVASQPYADFSALTGQTPLDHLAEAGTTLYAVGETGGIHSYNQASKETKTVATTAAPGGAKVKSVTTTTNGDLLLLTDKPAVISLNSADNSTAETSLTAGATWEKATSLDTVQQNVLLLDPDQNQIWRHAKSSAGYGKGEAFIKGAADLKGATDLVSGNLVIVLKTGGQLLQFPNGVPQPLNLTGTPPPADSAKGANAITANFSTNLIYVSDPANKRVLEYNLKGEYQRQFTGEMFGQTKSLTVDDKTNALYVLAGNKVYEIKLS